MMSRILVYDFVPKRPGPVAAQRRRLVGDDVVGADVLCVDLEVDEEVAAECLDEVDVGVDRAGWAVVRQ